MTTIDPERQKQAKEYARITRRLWLVDTTFSGVYAVAWLFFGWSIFLRNWLTVRWSLNVWILVPRFVLVFGGIYFVLNLPLELLRRLCPAASLWAIDSIAQKLDRGSAQRDGCRRAAWIDPARIALLGICAQPEIFGGCGLRADCWSSMFCFPTLRRF